MALTKVTGQVINSTTDLSVGVATVGGGTSTRDLYVVGVTTFASNVTIGGTLTYEDVTNIDSVGLITARQGISVTGGHVHLNDSRILKLGTDTDTQIVHTGSYGSINNSTGNFLNDIAGDWYVRNQAGSENRIIAKNDGAVELYNDNTKTFNTESWGNTSSGQILKVLAGEGVDATLQLVGDDGDDNADLWQIINDVSHGILNIQNYASGSWENNIVCTGNGAVSLYHDNSLKLATSSSGLDITGTVTDDGAIHDGDVSFAGANYNALWDKSKNALILNDNTQLNFGTDEDGDIYHDNSQMIINNATGVLRVRSSEVRLCNTTNSTYFTGISGGAAKLYHNDSVKLETTASGIKIEGGGGNGISIENSGGTNAACINLKNTLSSYVKEYRLAVAGSDGAYGTASSLFIRDQTSGATRVELQSGGDLKVNTGDLFFGTAGKGIVLGSTTNADANTLDDYEEGTWTPNPHDGSCTVTFAKYRKVGGTVTLWARVSGFSDTSTNDMIRIKGLPFSTSGSWAGVGGACMAQEVSESLGWVAFPEDDQIRFYATSTGSFAQLRHNELDSGHEIYFVSTYPVG